MLSSYGKRHFKYSCKILHNYSFTSTLTNLQVFFLICIRNLFFKRTRRDLYGQCKIQRSASAKRTGEKL